MARNSKIEWTDHTFNPWIGCTKISPACDGCYAENLMSNRMGRVRWGAGEERQRTSDANWRKPIAWDKDAERGNKRTFVFCASLADVFDNEVPESWRLELFDLIRSTPNLTWLLLTKRIGNVLKMTDPDDDRKFLPGNVAIGATIANQSEYDRDIPKLFAVKELRLPAFTFASCEPLLSPIRIDELAPDWIIAGGETPQGSHKARPSETSWFRHLRDQCMLSHRAFFMKQMTRKEEIPEDLQVRQFPFNRFESIAK